jgi:hypothetical protein
VLIFNVFPFFSLSLSFSVFLLERVETDQNDVPEFGRTQVPEQSNEKSARRDEKVS